MKDLKGKVALVTGGSKGIGYGIAEALLNSGLKVAITSRSQDAADEAAQKLGPDNVLPLESDVRSLESQQKAVNQIIDKWGQIDVVIANAGVGHFASIEELTPDQWNQTLDTNLTGVFYTIKATVESLKKSKGYFITIASLAGTNFFASGSAYNASKFGLVGFSQAVMLDLRQYGVKVTTIMPGSVTSHFNDHTPNPDDAWKIQPEDLGQMTVDLLQLDQRTLPSKIEVRPTTPPSK
ncbi:SDR family oxidoreductase [Mangrovivirga sp. M17]|uniref:SDR family oxidoreductase n=1 Tax=Mangrovivirga halotolerans TaxID=2993936 RepID=A0ABT3RNG5_9BACT|nr:SDR family oxidoreductase [Mangrovivirga halotolerans]MCX2743145.1 SDR family oxidoreductase [Mangrovivirga halotolerans]